VTERHPSRTIATAATAPVPPCRAVAAADLGQPGTARIAAPGPPGAAPECGQERRLQNERRAASRDAGRSTAPPNISPQETQRIGGILSRVARLPRRSARPRAMTTRWQRSRVERGRADGGTALHRSAETERIRGILSHRTRAPAAMGAARNDGSGAGNGAASSDPEACRPARGSGVKRGRMDGGTAQHRCAETRRIVGFQPRRLHCRDEGRGRTRWKRRESGVAWSEGRARSGAAVAGGG
jgi:hypothetical protein